MNPHGVCPAPLQRGAGLIELMLALTIGLFIVLGVIEEFISLKSTDAAVKQMSAMQNKQRIAMHFLRSAICSAGSFPNVLTRTATTQFPAISPYADGQFVGANTSDVVNVRYVATDADTARGCAGDLRPGHVYSDLFQINTGADISYLNCLEKDESDNSDMNVNLIADVVSMVVQYGVDTDGGGSVTQYRYTSAMNGFWLNAKTVRVTLGFKNKLTGPGQPATIILSEVIPIMAHN